MRQFKDTGICVFIAVLIVITHVFVIFAPVDDVIDWFNTDDAFYYYKVAQNIVAGKGITFDGTGVTNGFHPLWLLVLLPLFNLTQSDLILPLRLIIAIQTLLSVVSAVLFYLLLKRVVSRSVALLLSLTLVLYTPLHAFVNKGGTEAGLNLAITVLFLFAVSKMNDAAEYSAVRALKLGFLAIILLFARLDNVFLVSVVGIWLMGRWVSIHWRAKDTWHKKIVGMLRFGVSYYAPWSVALLVYMLLNRVYFGSYMPVSGMVKRWWGTLPFTVYGKPVQGLDGLVDVIRTPSLSGNPFGLAMVPILNWFHMLNKVRGGYWGPRLMLLIAIVLLVMIVGLALRRFSVVKAVVVRLSMIPMFFAIVLHIAYYVISGQVAWKEWYWLSEDILILMLIGLVVELIIGEIKPFKVKRILGYVLLAVMVIALVKPHIQRVWRIVNQDAEGVDHYYLVRAAWLEKHTEPGSVIGMTGSGSTAYFLPNRTVVNLDGLISSVDYFHHLQKSTADGYLQSKGLDYVFGNPAVILGSNPYMWVFKEHLAEEGTFNYKEKILYLWHFE